MTALWGLCREAMRSATVGKWYGVAFCILLILALFQMRWFDER